MVFKIGDLASLNAGIKQKTNITAIAAKNQTAISKTVKALMMGFCIKTSTVMIVPNVNPTAKLESRTIKA